MTYSTGNFPVWLPRCFLHDDVIKLKHFPRYWPSVRGSHRRPVDSPHNCQWRGALMFSLIFAWTNGWAIETPVIWDAIGPNMTSLPCCTTFSIEYAHVFLVLYFVIVCVVRSCWICVFHSPMVSCIDTTGAIVYSTFIQKWGTVVFETKM